MADTGSTANWKELFSNVIGRSKIIVYGDAVGIAQNILSSAGFFRIGLVIDLFAAILFFLAAWALYRLLEPVEKNLALLFLLLNLGGVTVQCLSDLFLLAGQMLLGGADYLKSFSPAQLQSLAMLSLYGYKNGFEIAQLFYGAWLFPLGYLVFRSGFLPRLLGIVLMLHCGFWLMTTIQFFIFPEFSAITNISWPLGSSPNLGLRCGCWLKIHNRP